MTEATVSEKAEDKVEKASPSREAPRRKETPEEKAARLADRRERLAQILNRGHINERLQVPYAKPGRVYKWPRDRKEDIEKYMALGFILEHIEDHGGEIGEDGSSKVVVGDATLMSISEDEWELIEDVREEQKLRKLGEAKRDYTSKSGGAPMFGDDSEARIRQLGG